jgi:3-oxoacyl-[acyl-carrier-protein] synthase-3
VPGAVITGWGIGVPDKVVTNEDLSATLDTSDAWITERTGIRQRHIGGTTSELAIGAGRQALERAGRATRGDRPAGAGHHHPRRRGARDLGHRAGRPGTRGGAFDLNAACSGFVYALVAAHGMVLAGARRVLVIGSDTLSRITDWDDRSPGRHRGRRGRGRGPRSDRRGPVSCWPGTWGPTARCATSSSATRRATSS